MKATKLALIFHFTLLTIFPSLAQEKRNVPAHVGLFYPISTNGINATDFENNFSFHLFTGLSGGETGFACYGLAGMVNGNMKGLQVSGIYNKVSETQQGFQLGGILNQVGGNSEGIQVAGISNLTGGNAIIQISGIYNRALDVNSMQVAGIVNTAKNVKGLQVSGISSFSTSLKGVQVSGISNISTNMDGLQIAGIINQTGDVEGIQIAGIVSNAKIVKGSQISGIVNRAEKVSGVQIAGLLNIADSSDYPIALINLIKNGEKRIGISTDENLSTIISFRSGGRKIYGIIGGGYNFNTDHLPYVIESGLGIKLLDTRVFRMDLEAFNHVATDFKNTDYFKSGVRLIPILNLSEKIQLFGGPSLSYINSDKTETFDHSGTVLWKQKNYNSTRDHSLQLGFSAGLQIKI